MDELDLKACPFCGGMAFVIIDRGKQYKAVYVECEDCGARVPIEENRLISYWKSKNKWNETVIDKAVKCYGKAICEAWNRREE